MSFNEESARKIINYLLEDDIDDLIDGFLL